MSNRKQPGNIRRSPPFATVIVPIRGLDQGLQENIAAIFSQDYPAYEVIFVSDDEKDPHGPSSKRRAWISKVLPAQLCELLLPVRQVIADRKFTT
jgi:cellulose synthase/poly-beta-1,6-N-acetylglucosamine synthase-like glycosyltransferase